MGVEAIPIALGVVIIPLGLAIIWDAWGPQAVGPMRERRRRARVGVNVPGELLAGLGIVLLGVALVGGQRWRLETILVILATLCIAIGALRNWKYFREVFLFRGAVRRDDATKSPKPGKMRIR